MIKIYNLQIILNNESGAEHFVNMLLFFLFVDILLVEDERKQL